MARIRSTHPEQWTDDDFVSCSPLARLLGLGIRNYTDDNGIFEWNPTKLKMRVLPADNADVPALLDELVASRQVYHYTVEGKEYGIVRNFTRFQKPKKPTFQYPIPSEPLPKGYELSKSYSPTSSPPVPNEAGNQAADGEESSRREEKQPPVQAQQSPPAPARVEPPASPRCAALTAIAEGARVRIDAMARMHLRQWAEEGLTDQQLTDAIAVAREKKPHPEMIPIRFVVSLMADVIAARAKPTQPRGKAAIAGAKRLIAEREREEREEQAPKPPRDGALVHEPTGTWERIRDDIDVISNMGSDKGLACRAGEDWDDFTARVLAAWWAELPWTEEVDADMAAKVAKVRAQGITPDEKHIVVVEREGRRYQHTVT